MEVSGWGLVVVDDVDRAGAGQAADAGELVVVADGVEAELHAIGRALEVVAELDRQLLQVAGGAELLMAMKDVGLHLAFFVAAIEPLDITDSQHRGDACGPAGVAGLDEHNSRGDEQDRRDRRRGPLADFGEHGRAGVGGLLGCCGGNSGG